MVLQSVNNSKLLEFLNEIALEINKRHLLNAWCDGLNVDITVIILEIVH